MSSNPSAAPGFGAGCQGSVAASRASRSGSAAGSSGSDTNLVAFDNAVGRAHDHSVVGLDAAGKLVRDTSPGNGGSHGPQHEFVVETRVADHPIMRGLPRRWRHTQDECYDRLRGPAENMTVLATAFSSPEFKGTGRHEPALMVIDHGKGRVFHTILGHEDYSFESVGFITTFLRGVEWAATGKVTIPVPEIGRAHV